MLASAIQDLFLDLGLQKKYWIAYSGGLDSHVLLSVCAKLRSEHNLNICAIHVNHNLSPHAASWVKHCETICQNDKIPLITKSISLDLNAGDSLEEIAREKRYAIFSDLLDKDDVLFTAHHQEDQAETVLLQLLRGAGPKGLAAMPRIKLFAKGLHARPFLSISRAELEKFANENKLVWLEDESNNDTSLSRNFIRHQILSPLVSRWPKAAATIARSAAHCGEAETLLQEFIEKDYLNVSGSRANTLSVAKLKELSHEKQKLLLRTWIQRNGYTLPNIKKLTSIQRDVFSAAWDRVPSVEWGGVVLRRYRDDLYLMPLQNDVIDKNKVYTWALNQPLKLPGVGLLYADNLPGQGLHSSIQQVTVGYRQGGEILTLSNRGRHSLKNLFQEWDVLPWERAKVPLVFLEDSLIAVVGYFYHQDFRAKPDEMGICIGLERL